jgi:transposase
MDLERLKFLSRVNQSSGRKIRELSECWFSINKPKPDGYCNYQTDWAKENGVIYAHQASYKLFKDESYKPSREHPCSHLCESKDDILHRRCCNPEHLYIANSIAENIADRDRTKGNYQSVKQSGCKSGNSKFSEEDVKKIIALREEGMWYKHIAERFKCSRRTIEKLCLKKTYKQEQITVLVG